MLKYAILGFLGYKDMTGYEIKQRMDRSTRHFWHAKLSQIYTTLKSLEKEKFVFSSVEEQEDRPDRRVYSLTKIGEDELTRWLSEPFTELSPKKETLVLKMFFSARLQPQEVFTQLQVQLDLHRRQLEYFCQEVVRSIDMASKEFPTLETDARMWEATRRFGEMYEEIYVRWLEEMLEMVQKEM